MTYPTPRITRISDSLPGYRLGWALLLTPPPVGAKLTLPNAIYTCSLMLTMLGLEWKVCTRDWESLETCMWAGSYGWGHWRTDSSLDRPTHAQRFNERWVVLGVAVEDRAL